MQIPDLTQKVIGFRQWSVATNNKLYPIGGISKGAWEPGPQHAYCAKHRSIGGRNMPDPCIPVVDPYCECGFYALHALSDAHWGGDDLRGIVLGWGRMAIHNEGWRAQFVELAALIYPRRATQQEKEDVDIIAQGYNVPTVEWERAEYYAKEFGDYCPESLKPRSWTKDELEADAEMERQWRHAKDLVNDQVEKLSANLSVDELRREDAQKMCTDALNILDPQVPEAYAALHNIYVPNVGELLDGLVNGITVDYVPKPDPITPSEIKVDRNFELSISTNSTVLWLPLQSPVRNR